MRRCKILSPSRQGYYHMFRERATDQFDSQRSAVNLAVPDSKFHLSTGRKTDIPKLFMVDASFEGGGEGKKIGLTPGAREFLRRERNRISKSGNTVDIQKAARQSLRESRCAGFEASEIRKRSRVTPVERIVAQLSTAGGGASLYEISMAVIGLNLFMYDLN